MPFSKKIGIPFSTVLLLLATTPCTRIARSDCEFVQNGYGPAGQVPVRAEKVVDGLEVPWGIGFLPDGSMLVTERPGRIRLVRGGQLVPQPVATIPVAESNEGGLLGIAIDPQFASNRMFYIYYTAVKNGTNVNRVERFTLSNDSTRATSAGVLLDDIQSSPFHNGGRLRFGPDGALYIGTGDARNPELSQDPASLNGKVLSIDVRTAGAQATPFVLGVRNVEAFDWLSPDTLAIADHGPTGELGREGADEVSVARQGDNLGWPNIYQCESAPGMVSPILSWNDAAPPGGASVYRGSAIPEWMGSFIIGTLRSESLQRVVINPGPPASATLHETYFQGQFGRLRDVVNGPDGELYVTTSNCDSRGECPPEKDAILKIAPGAPNS